MKALGALVQFRLLLIAPWVHSGDFLAHLEQKPEQFQIEQVALVDRSIVKIRFLFFFIL